MSYFWGIDFGFKQLNNKEIENMKRLALVLSVIAVVGFLALPVWAESPGPSAEKLVKDFYVRSGEAVPQVTFTYLFDFVSNNYTGGFGTVFVVTNYSSMVRNRIQGFIVPVGANPGEEIDVDFWLNPYEVAYIDLGDLGLGDEHGWAMLTSSIQDFGCTAIVYNTVMTGMTAVKAWYWWTE
jgi:hypothetical protein